MDLYLSIDMQKQLKIEYSIQKTSYKLLAILIPIAIAIEITLFFTEMKELTFSIPIGFVVGYITSFIGLKMSVWAVETVLEFETAKYLNFVNFAKMCIIFGILALSVYNIYIEFWAVFAGLLVIKTATYMTKEVKEN